MRRTIARRTTLGVLRENYPGLKVVPKILFVGAEYCLLERRFYLLNTWDGKRDYLLTSRKSIEEGYTNTDLYKVLKCYVYLGDQSTGKHHVFRETFNKPC